MIMIMNILLSENNRPCTFYNNKIMYLFCIDSFRFYDNNRLQYIIFQHSVIEHK